MTFLIPRPPRTDEFFQRNKWYWLLDAYLKAVRNIDNTFTLNRISTSVSITTGREIIIGCLSTPLTITLATAELADGRVYMIKDEGGTASGGSRVTIDTQGSETIDGVDSIDIKAKHGVLRVYSDGTNWFSF